MLRTDNLGKRVHTSEGDIAILEGVSLEIKAGESLAIVGPSGSGKSTLLGLLAGLDVPSTGIVTLDGQPFSQLDEDGRAAMRARYVGFVFQNFQLLPGLTALENVMLPMELSGNKQAKAAATEYLDKVGLQSRITHYPRQLSGGEQQRVALARAFACQPKVLFADEPTGNLDAKTGEKIKDLLFELNKSSAATLVLVTHEPALAERCARQIRIEAGRLVSGTN
jgi:putative ABC transport system ATP-binding protein